MLAANGTAEGGDAPANRTCADAEAARLRSMTPAVARRRPWTREV
jgi:hypothetical protein